MGGSQNKELPTGFSADVEGILYNNLLKSNFSRKLTFLIGVHEVFAP